MPLAFAHRVYGKETELVSWQGVQLEDCPELVRFIAHQVRNRVEDTELKRDLHSVIDGIALTDMQSEELKSFLLAPEPDPPSWAIGESLAESYLEAEHGVAFPWNMRRDKRTPSASLPGADIVGYDKRGAKAKFAFGEVKSSQDKRTPPAVVAGRSGTDLTYQMFELIDKAEKIRSLILWLAARCAKPESEDYTAFNDALETYGESGYRDIALFGVLIRDTDCNEADLRELGIALEQRAEHPTRCDLVALYLPWELEKLIDLTCQGGSKNA